MDRSHFSTLSRADAAVAIRSYPGRFRTVLRQTERTKASAADELDEIVVRPGPDGVSAAGLVATLVGRFGAIDEALRVMAILDQPALGAGVLAEPPPPAADSSTTAEGAMTALATAGEALADRIEGIANGDLDRTGTASDGTTLRVLDVIHEAAAAGRTALDLFEQTLEQASR